MYGNLFQGLLEIFLSSTDKMNYVKFNEKILSFCELLSELIFKFHMTLKNIKLLELYSTSFWDIWSEIVQCSPFKCFFYHGSISLFLNRLTDIPWRRLIHCDMNIEHFQQNAFISLLNESIFHGLFTRSSLVRGKLGFRSKTYNNVHFLSNGIKRDNEDLAKIRPSMNNDPMIRCVMVIDDLL